MAKKQIETSCCGSQETTQTSCGCAVEKPAPKEECSCGEPTKEITKYKEFCGAKTIQMKTGGITFAPVKLCWTDLLGNFFVRFGFNRMNYAIKPGLYATGKPDKKSPVLVSANYKMSFDSLRKELSGINAWILVLDTKGVNVWCAAGKGTFGTHELVRQIKLTKLQMVVDHKQVIVPQLGAPGVEAHLVRKDSGFKVIYGPVEACDINKFLSANQKATEDMRTVKFGIIKRLEVTGIEFVMAMKIMFSLSFAAVIIASFTKTGFSLVTGFSNALYFIGALFVAAISSAVIPAALLPVIPGRMFSVKGAISGFVTSLIFVYFANMTILTSVSVVILSSTMASFVFMNYTGTTTFTSLTGVRREIAVSVPFMIVAALAGIIIQIIDFVQKGAIKWN